MFLKGYLTEEKGTRLFKSLFLLGRIYSMKLQCSLKPIYSIQFWSNLNLPHSYEQLSATLFLVPGLFPI